MELFSKILTPTDVEFKMSFPTWVTREHFRLENGGHSLDFQVMDNRGGELWTFRLSTRKEGHPKPELTRGWIDFVRQKGLKEGDKIIFLVQGDRLHIQALRKIQLMGTKFWGEIINPN